MRSYYIYALMVNHPTTSVTSLKKTYTRRVLAAMALRQHNRRRRLYGTVRIGHAYVVKFTQEHLNTPVA